MQLTRSPSATPEQVTKKYEFNDSVKINPSPVSKSYYVDCKNEYSKFMDLCNELEEIHEDDSSLYSNSLSSKK